MRYELRLILWVTAIGLLMASVWRGFWRDADLSSQDLVVGVTNIYQEDSHTLERPDRGKKLWVGTLPKVDLGQRSMFKVDAPPPPEIVTGSTDARPVELPILKGIVDQAGRRAAVFSEPAGSFPYAVTSVGEQFGGYTLVEIEGERVVARSAEGDAVIFKLRGAGELP